MKRVLVFSDEYPPAGGGAGTVAAQLASDLARAGAVVHLLTGDESPHSDPAAYEHVRVRRERFVWPLAYWTVLRHLDLNGFDLIVLNDFVAAYIAGLIFPARALARAVVIVHGEDARYVYQKSSLKHWLFGYRRAYTRLLVHCRRVVAVSNYAQQIFCKQTPISLDAKVEVCHAGLAFEKMSRPAPIEKQDLGIPSQSRLLFSASRLVREKGLLDQLRLFDEAIRGGADLYWFIAGDGPLRAQLKERIVQLGLEERVRLLGRLPRSELATYFTAADVFWLLSHATYETMGLVYLEAAFYGTPSIGLRNYGVIESISEGRSGLFYSCGEIYPLIEKSISEISEEGCVSHAHMFSSELFAARMLALSA